MISILILTLNEEVNLPACLKSVSWADDIVVLDSGSTDRTLEIAGAFGARVVVRRLETWAEHQNWALQNIAFKNPWVYYSDADEVVTPALMEEMLRAVKSPGSSVAFRLRYKNYFCGRWLRHCGIYPTWVLRLMRPEMVRFSRTVNPTAVASGPVGQLREHFHHFSFRKGIASWIEKHNRYSSQEAVETRVSVERARPRLSGLLSIDPSVRRQTLKEMSFRLPFRPALRFMYMYFLRGGFLDGWPGFQYCCLLSFYEYMITLKVLELERAARGREM